MICIRLSAIYLFGNYLMLSRYSFQVFGGKPYIRHADEIAFHVSLFIANNNGCYVNYYMVFLLSTIITFQIQMLLFSSCTIVIYNFVISLSSLFCDIYHLCSIMEEQISDEQALLTLQPVIMI